MSEKYKVLVAVEGIANKGELVVGGSFSAVGGISRQLVTFAEVAEVGEDVLLSVVQRTAKMFHLTYTDAQRLSELRKLAKAQARIDRKSVV